MIGRHTVCCWGLIGALVATMDASCRAERCAGPERCGVEARDRDKTGTTARPKVMHRAQMPRIAAFAQRIDFAAEGTGVEPATGCPAPEFQSGR